MVLSITAANARIERLTEVLGDAEERAWNGYGTESNMCALTAALDRAYAARGAALRAAGYEPPKIVKTPF